MCGICGRYRFVTMPEESSQAAADRQLVARMNKALEHRGPDQAGSHQEAGLVFGHRRLSIIGLGNGQQPMTNEDQTIWLVFNGEIYNYLPLRDELHAAGHQFKTSTDTETIIHLYEQYGLDFLQKLNGMFALALWDSRQNRFLLARDRLGQKPLHYHLDKDKITFSSELYALLQDRELTRSVEPTALHNFLTFQYVPSPGSMFTGIKKLPPAHMMLIEQGAVSIKQYWQLDYLPKETGTEAELLERFSEKFEEAVRLRMMSEVPFGAFLSGGIDSSAVVYAMSKQSQQPIKTFVIKFDEHNFDESGYAREVADLFGCEHHEYTVKADCLAVLPQLIKHYGEPFADPSAIPTYYVCQQARQEVTVALCGDAGDESWGGYDRYPSYLLTQKLQRIPPSLRKSFAALAGLLPATGVGGKINRYMQNLNLSSFDRYLKMMLSFDEQQKQTLYSADFKQVIKNYQATDHLRQLFKDAPVDNDLDRVLYLDTHSYLPDDLLVKIDIASMATSLEARSPFLDHELFSLTARYPQHLKIKGSTRKYLLKKYLEGKVPNHIVHRPKAGFSVPISSWFREELKDYLPEILLDGEGLDFFNTQALERLIKEHQTGVMDHGFRLWPLLNFKLWYQSFIAGFQYLP